MTNSYRYIYYGPSCEKLDTLSMILNGFESIFFLVLYRNMKNMQKVTDSNPFKIMDRVSNF